MTTRENFNNVLERMMGNVDKVSTHVRPDLSLIVQHKYNQHRHAKGIVSISLFGNVDNPKFYSTYVKPILTSARNIEEILPGWYLRIYLDPNLPEEIREELIQHDCEVFIMSESSINLCGTFWRFLPASEKLPFITHDADMELTKGGFYVPDLSKHVKCWMKSDKPFIQRRLGHIN